MPSRVPQLWLAAPCWARRAAAALAVVTLAGCGSSPARHAAESRSGPVAIFEADPQLDTNPALALATLRRLGVQYVRVLVQWNRLAPQTQAAARPAGFDAADPGQYPAPNWTPLDRIVREAAKQGIAVFLCVSGPPPRWASVPGAPPGAGHGAWKPRVRDFALFVHAVATRYDGSFTPAGQTTPLPRVSLWSIWNEPNYGVNLAPQAIDDSAVEVAPAMYRRLLDVGWKALEATGHGHDTILIGELAPRGQTVGNVPGNYSGMVPLRFLRALYCVDSNFRPLTGTAAAARSCPRDAAGSAAFPGRHPALFQADGVAVHPYPQGIAPNIVTSVEPDYADLAAIPRLEQTLDSVLRAYGSSRRLPIYDTEDGYQTNPPETILRAISPRLASYYMNWSEYLLWRDPRVRSYDQYLLRDTAHGNFATGLEFADGTPKATYYAYRMSLFLPVTSPRRGQPLEVWGCARPARVAWSDTGRPQSVALQFKPLTQSAYKTIRTAALNPSGYFDVMQPFSSSGSLRLAWSYPGGEQIYSRTVSITISG